MGESDFENLSVRLLAQLLEQFGVDHQRTLGVPDCWYPETAFNIFFEGKEPATNLDTGLRRFVCTLWHCGSHFLDSKQ